MIINATSHTIKNIWPIFLFIFLIFIAFFGTLKSGIHIENIDFSSVKVEQLYIKLDKKLIVKAKSLVIKKQQNSSLSLKESALIIDNFLLIDQLFEMIDIEQLSYNQEGYKVYFTRNTFYIQSIPINVELQFFATGHNTFDMNILKASIKPLELNLSGKISIDLEKELFVFENTFELFGIQGLSLIDIKKNLLTYHIQSENFIHQHLTDLMNFIAPKVELDPLIKAWIHENIVGENYKIEFLEGQYDLKTEEYFPHSIHAKAIVEKAFVTFEPSVPPAAIDTIGILLMNDQLHFDVINPIYENKPLDKVSVAINNVITTGTKIIIDLTAKSLLDDKIHKILHAFKIHVPIVQKSGATQANIRLDIKFLPFDINATGTFSVFPGLFTLDGLEMSTQYGDIILDNTLIHLKNANLRYKNLFDINATGTYDAKKEYFTGAIDINTLLLDFGKTHLIDMKNIQNKEASFYLENNQTNILLPFLEASMHFGDKYNRFELHNLEKIAPYSPLMKDMNLMHGTGSVHTKDFLHYDANVSLHQLTTPLLENGVMVNQMNINLSTDTKVVDLTTLGSKLTAKVDDNLTLHVKDINLSISQNSEDFDIPIPTTIIGKNSSLEIQESLKHILSDHYVLKMKGKELHLISQKQKTHFEVEKKKNYFSLHGISMDAPFSNALLGKSYFINGDFSLQIEGLDDKNNRGMFILQKTYIKDLKFFNNLMATINAVPSLIIFTNPNFSSEGYFVENGYIEFEQHGDIYTLKELQLRGASADIVGNGTIDISKNTIHLTLQIRTLKTFSSILDMVPLVGGLILGEDKRISTNITVTGSLDDPTIETHLVTDALMSPLNIIKRTLELPFELFK